MIRALKILTLLAVIAIFVGAVGFGFLMIVSGGNPVNFVQTIVLQIRLSSREDEVNQPVSGDNTPIRFVVNTGDTPRVIAGNLVSAGLISDADLFVDYARVKGLDTQLEAGTYFLNQTQTLAQIAQALTDSASSIIIFRVPEGTRLEEITKLIDENSYFDFSGADFMAVAGPGAEMDANFATMVGLPRGASLEGFLFPDTYQLPATVTPTMLRDTLTQHFLDVVGVQLFNDAAANGFSMFQIVTLASIVEREAVHADEDPLIASVYHNRLVAGMRLDADPTIQYALNGARGRWWPSLTPADYTNVVSDYNTYLNYGLPPGPIANPSLAAIRAAVYPAESSYYYFRASCTRLNYHDFSTTYEEHLASGC